MPGTVEVVVMPVGQGKPAATAFVLTSTPTLATVELVAMPVHQGKLV
jgi:hypothetical protein